MLCEVGMRIPVEPVGEELLHLVAAIAARRQADRMQHDQVDLRAGRAAARNSASAAAGRSGTSRPCQSSTSSSVIGAVALRRRRRCGVAMPRRAMR